MAEGELTPAVIRLVAERFRALGEPARLQILQALRDGEQRVSELVEETGLAQANASKHLQVLHGLGFIERRKTGQFVYYRLADEGVFRLCDIMCGRLDAEAVERQRVLRGRE
jgi:DNA-binding transcriptional ArsR family regulator